MVEAEPYRLIHGRSDRYLSPQAQRRESLAGDYSGLGWFPLEWRRLKRRPSGAGSFGGVLDESGEVAHGERLARAEVVRTYRDPRRIEGGGENPADVTEGDKVAPLQPVGAEPQPPGRHRLAAQIVGNQRPALDLWRDWRAHAVRESDNHRLRRAACEEMLGGQTSYCVDGARLRHGVLGDRRTSHERGAVHVHC